jgi:hypothetical protein
VTPAAPAFPPVQQPAPSSLPPVVPDAGLAPAAPAASDPFGSLFTADDPGATAQRLAASPPPLTSPAPMSAPPASPPTGDIVADADPMKALFGLETSENPALEVPSAPPPVLEPAAPVYTPEPVYAPPPVFTEPPAPASPPEPTYAAPAYTPEPPFAQTPVPPAPVYASEPLSDNDASAGTQFFGGGTGDWEEPPDLDRTTAAERIGLVLAFLLPPVGLIASIVLAAQSARRRGWVHGFVRATLVIAVVTTLAAGIAGAYFYKVLDDQRRHDSIQAASAQFCSTIADNPDMISQPTFGFPAPAASIPDTLASIQAYVDKWDALADVSPSGIRADVTKVADSARDILDSVTTTRLVNDEENVAVMSSVASASNIVGWSQEYCG